MELKDFEYNFIDQLYDYDGLWGRKAKCGLKVLNNLVIATDIYKGNPGGSITEYCAELAMIICDEHNIKYQDLRFIHHTPEVNSSYEFLEETFYDVHFDITENNISNPDWDQINRDNVVKLVEAYK